MYSAYIQRIGEATSGVGQAFQEFIVGTYRLEPLRVQGYRDPALIFGSTVFMFLFASWAGNLHRVGSTNILSLASAPHCKHLHGISRR
jgi:hypothetical protein